MNKLTTIRFSDPGLMLARLDDAALAEQSPRRYSVLYLLHGFPGRPLAFGELRGPERAVPIFGLPGNTVSALVTFEIFVRPALLRMQSRANVSRPRAKARLVEPVDKPAFLRFFARGIHDAEAGTVRLTGPQGSGILRSMSLANCLIDLPVGPSRIEQGEIVDVILTERPEQ